MNVFFDTSALVKRYIEEPESAQVVEVCSNADSLYVSIIIYPEMVSTLNRLRREALLSTRNYNHLKRAFFSDLEDYGVCPLSPDVLRHTVASLEKYPLRALDAIHVGSALFMGPDLFVTADARQAMAAEQTGLTVKIIR